MPENHRLWPGVRAATKPVALLWTLALVLAGLALVSAPAALAAPSPDMLTPTGNYSRGCAIGRGEACQTDNASMSYYMDSGGKYELEEPDRIDVRAAMVHYNNTDLVVSYDSSPSFSGSAETDVIFQEGSDGFSDTTVATTWCNDVSDNHTYRCDQQYIMIRGNGHYTARSAGHETGHAVGLLHGPWAAPAQGLCAASMGIMRAAADCLDKPALGGKVIENINAVY